MPNDQPDWTTASSQGVAIATPSGSFKLSADGSFAGNIQLAPGATLAYLFGEVIPSGDTVSLATLSVAGVVTGKTYVSTSSVAFPYRLVIDPLDSILAVTATASLTGTGQFSVVFVPAGLALPPNRPCDSSLENDPGVGGTASVTFAAAAGQRWVLNALGGTLLQTGATAGAANLQVLDGAAVIWKEAMSVVGTAFAIDRVARSPMLLQSSIGNGMTVNFGGAASATVAEYVNASAWQQPF